MTHSERETKWTEGEWVAVEAPQPEAQFRYCIMAKGYGAVGYQKGHKDRHDDANWVLTKEDAQLMAASKEMYAALEAVVQIADRDTIAFRAAHAAMRKARGES